MAVTAKQIKSAPFAGFPAEGIKFLQALERNNKREWFDQHREEFKIYLEGPAREFAAAMEDAFAQLIGKPFSSKLFRIYRDVRFSKDKTPYNTHMRAIFYESQPEGCKDYGSGVFFFSLEPKKIIIGAGTAECGSMETKGLRAAVFDDGKGGELAKIITSLEKKDGFRMHEPELKRVPAGYDKDHPRESLLRRKSLAMWYEAPHDKALFSSAACKYLVGKYKELLPLYNWVCNI